MPAFQQTVFRATHNSYSGNLVGGARGGLVGQLNHGVRLVELDIHSEGFQSNGDYQIGHGGAGDEVDHTAGNGNPASNQFGDWVQQIASWSNSNPAHAPLQLVLDMKNTLTADSARQGNHGALNARLRRAFGASLFPATNPKPWPDVSSMSGKVLVVLSGDVTSREAYVLDRGITPAVSVNSRGQVVEVHESEAGNHSLWYWVGTLGPNGQVTWNNHGRYGTGTTPAVAVNDDGWVVEVHKSQSQDRLWYQLGRINGAGDIDWISNHDFDDGILPSIQFENATGNSLREIHRSQSHDQNWAWNVTLNPAASSLSFAGNATTSAARWDTMHSGAVGVASDASHGLVYSTHAMQDAPIRYEQVAFVEHQIDDNSSALEANARFYAALSDNSDGHDNTGFLLNARHAGMVTRGWDFKQASPRLSPPENYAATDQPFAQWYVDYCTANGAVS